MKHSISQIIGGPVFLGLIVIVETLVIIEFIRRFKTFREKRSPLFFCYVFILLAGIPLIVKAIGTTLLKDIIIVFELALSLLFTSYSLIIYTWIMVIYNVKFVKESWITATKWIYIIINLIVYASALASGFYFSAVYYLTFVLSVFVNVAYFVTYRMLKKYFSAVTYRQLTALSRVANRVVGFQSFTLVIYILIKVPYTPESAIWIDKHYPRLIEMQIILQALVLLYNLRKMSRTPQAPKINVNNATYQQTSTTPTTTNNPTSPLYDNSNDGNMQLNNSPIEMTTFSTSNPSIVPNTSHNTPSNPFVQDSESPAVISTISSHSSSPNSFKHPASIENTPRHPLHLTIAPEGLQKSITIIDESFNNNSLMSNTINSDSSQIFTNISQFNNSNSLSVLDSSGLSQVHASSTYLQSTISTNSISPSPSTNMNFSKSSFSHRLPTLLQRSSTSSLPSNSAPFNYPISASRSFHFTTSNNNPSSPNNIPPP